MDKDWTQMTEIRQFWTDFGFEASLMRAHNTVKMSLDSNISPEWHFLEFR